MAGRSVGNIEITVSADTGRLTAQLTKAGAESGKAYKTAAEKEIKDLRAVVNLEKLDALVETKRLRTEIEAGLRGIPIDVDFASTTAELAGWREEEEAHKLLLQLALSEISLAEAAAKVEGFTERQWEILINTKLDINELDLELARREAERRMEGIEAEIEVRLDDARARARMQEWLAERRQTNILAEVELHRATEQLEAFMAEKHRLQIGMDLDVSDLQRQFRDMRIATEAERWDINTRLRTGTFQAEIDRIRREEEAEFIELRLKLERSLAEAQVAEFEAFVAARDAELNLALETAMASAEMTTWIAEQQLKKIDIPLDPDLLAATVAFDAWLEAQRRKGIDVTVDPKTVRATIAFKAWIQRMQLERINVQIDADSAAESGRVAGEAAGGGFGSGWQSWLFDNQKLLVGAVALLGNDIAVALEGILSAGTAVASSAFSALGGAIGGLIPLVAGLGAALGALVVGFQGIGKAMGSVTKEFADAAVEGRKFDLSAESIQETLKRLAPEAQNFVTAFAGIFPQLDKIRQAVQGELFAGLDTALGQLSTTTIPNIGDALGVAADSLNLFFRKLSDASQGIDFSGLLEDLQPAIDAVGDALVSLFQAFEPLIKAATPAAKELADSFRNAADNLRDMIERGEASGRLTAFFNEGVDSLKLWWELIRNVGDALFTIFQAGKAQGDSFVETLADIVGRFDDWLESDEGQAALIDFFETGARTMKALVPILKGLQGLFSELVSPESITRFESLTDALGRALPFLGQILDFAGRVGTITSLVEAFARIGEALQPAVPALDAFADALGTILLGAIDALTPLVMGLGPLIGEVAEALTPLAKPLVDIAQHMMELVTPDLLDGLQALSQVILDLSPLVVKVLEALMPLIDPAMQGLITALQLATPLLEMTSELLQALEPVFDALIPIVQLFADVLALVNAPLKLLGDFADATGITLGDLANPATAASEAIHELFTKDIKGSAIIADQAAAKNEELANKILLIVGAAQVTGAAVEVASRQILAAGDNLGGFAVNADLAREAEDHFNQELSDVDTDPIGEVSDSLSRAADAAGEASDAADILRDAWDRLFGGAIELSDAQDAFSETLLKIADIQKERAERLEDVKDAQEGVVDAIDAQKDAQAKLNEEIAKEDSDPAEIERLTRARDDANRSVDEANGKLADANKAYAENLTAIRGNTEAAIENRSTVKDGIKQAIDIAAAKVREGASWEQARKSVLEQKEALVEQLVQQGFNEDAVRDYIAQMNLTPKNIRTAIELANRDAVAQDLDDISFKIKQMDGKGATVPVNVSGLEAVMAGLDGIKGTRDDITRKTAKLAIQTEGVPTTKKELQDVIDKANELDGKTANVTVNVRRTAEGGFDFGGGAIAIQHGGFTRRGAFNVAGEAGSEFVRFGQRVGLVHGPTLLPGGVRVTSTMRSEKLMRDFLAAVGGSTAGPRKQVNVVQNITPMHTDPEMVAVSVLNRAAVLAAR